MAAHGQILTNLKNALNRRPLLSGMTARAETSEQRRSIIGAPSVRQATKIAGANLQNGGRRVTPQISTKSWVSKANKISVPGSVQFVVEAKKVVSRK